ncbi:MAG: acetyl-CoA carboxylase carboxyltransferase subunit alpha [Brevinematales bacterium]|nr:acetyl-CoA carboxylase carboxyltransferase subunit alpha [Brevinematales bacterium]
MYYLDFETPIKEIEENINLLKKNSDKADLSGEIAELERQRKYIIETIYKNLSPFQVVKVARHPERPNFIDYVNNLFEDFLEIHGDRYFGDDKAIITGFGKIDGQKFMVIGQEKGKDTKDKIYRNFGMPQPEGYRKALRAMKLAEKFKLPILTFVDTSGAYPGIDSEERGQGEAIAKNLFEMSGLKTQIIVTVIGEGGSGGALAIGVGDRVLMLENSIYSVISPEGCASILWHDATKMDKAAKALKITSRDLLELGVIDEIIPEPYGGAHRDPETTFKNVKEYLLKHYSEIKKFSIPKLLQKRYEKFRKMGKFAVLSE